MRTTYKRLPLNITPRRARILRAAAAGKVQVTAGLGTALIPSERVSLAAEVRRLLGHELLAHGGPLVRDRGPQAGTEVYGWHLMDITAAGRAVLARLDADPHSAVVVP